MMNFKVLVNTTDSFEDCWLPFFTLFRKYWPEFDGEIFLNTETKKFTFPGLNIISIRNNSENRGKRITWSECLIRALNVVEDEIILYMQEDYFLKDTVKNELIKNYVEMMHNNLEIDCIHLTDQGIINDSVSEKYDGLYTALPEQRYLINCQAALWRKKSLLTLLRPYENAWQFEEFGSKRASGMKIFGVDKNWIKLDEFEIVPYIFTGVIQGKWYEPVKELFSKESIEVDFSERGFVNSSSRRSLKQKIFYLLNRVSVLYKNSISAR